MWNRNHAHDTRTHTDQRRERMIFEKDKEERDCEQLAFEPKQNESAFHRAIRREAQKDAEIADAERRHMEVLTSSRKLILADSQPGDIAPSDLQELRGSSISSITVNRQETQHP